MSDDGCDRYSPAKVERVADGSCIYEQVFFDMYALYLEIGGRNILSGI